MDDGDKKKKNIKERGGHSRKVRDEKNQRDERTMPLVTQQAHQDTRVVAIGATLAGTEAPEDMKAGVTADRSTAFPTGPLRTRDPSETPTSNRDLKPAEIAAITAVHAARVHKYAGKVTMPSCS